jgi:hypothetical protein
MNPHAFSISHDWSLDWRRIFRHESAGIIRATKEETRALKALGAVGVIGSLQLSRFFSANTRKTKKRLSRMVNEQKLVRHEIKRNKHKIPIYTLGSKGARVANIADYEENYWVSYKPEDVLKSLLFFQLYEKFPGAEILPAPKPFVGAISFRDRLFYVYAVRGDLQDLLMYLKWKPFPERILVITESLNHLDPLNAYAPDLKIRAITDADLKGSFQDLFYMWDDGWKKEADHSKS